MKNLHHPSSFLALLTTLLLVGTANAQSIAIGKVSAQRFCAGDSVSVDFTVTGFFGHTNVFTLQLSNYAGGFANGFQNIGSITDTLPGKFTIKASIPGAVGAAQYRIRIIGAVPYIESPDNGSDISISTTPYAKVEYKTMAFPNGNNAPIIMAGVATQFSATTSGGHTLLVDSIFWDFGSDATPQSVVGGLSQNVTFGNSGTKKISVRIVAGNCGSTIYTSTVSVFGCNPIIPHNAIVIDSDSSAEQGGYGGHVYWVNPGKTFSLYGACCDTVFAEPGSTIKSGLQCVVYLKKGAVYSSAELGSLIISKGDVTSPEYGPNYDTYAFSCSSLEFDYSVAPPNVAHPLAVNDNVVTNPIEIFPNPTTGSITIQSAPENIVNVTVLNLLGETLISLPKYQESNFTIDCSKLVPGTYYVRFQTTNGVITKKIIRQ